MTRVRIALELIVAFLPGLVFLVLGERLTEGSPLLRHTAVWLVNAIMLVLVYVSLRLRGQNWSHIGLDFRPGRWKQWLKPVGQSIVVFACASLAFLLGAAAMAKLAAAPQGADFSSYNFIKGNLPLLLLSLAAVYIVSSFGEEVLYRGFLMTRVAEIMGKAAAAVPVTVLISTLLFGLIHYHWGIIGMVQTGCVGLVLAVAYVLVKRNLWVNVLAHAYLDTILLVQLYLA